jgi:penicillin amidase
MFRKLSIALAAILLLAAIGLAGAYYYYVRRPLPQTEGTIELKGLGAPVQVLRDRWGVPHIYAQNNHDLLFAQGFVQAQDRLWQMEINRRLAAGRLSEIIGPEMLPVDRLLRSFGIARAARKEIETCLPLELELLRAYADGVNAYLQAHLDRLPLEFRVLGVTPEPWQPEDSIGWAKLMALQGAKNWQEEIVGAMLVQRLGAEKTEALLGLKQPRAQAAVPRALELAALWPAADLSDRLGLPALIGGSNNWVVQGSRTETGAPLLANDMHLDVRIPSVWYEMHLTGGDFDVIGLSLPGVPMIIAGHNRAVAWGITFAYTDTQDLFLERMNPDQPDQYLYKGKWKTAERISETIRVKGSAAPVAHETLWTIHGPILSPLVPAAKGLGYALALRWSAHDPGGLIVPLARMNAASDIAQFKAAAVEWSDPPINLVCADRQGDIGYVLAGRIPIRPQGHGLGPFAGWDGQYDWRGYVPPDEKPSLLNPDQGFVATANNRVVGEDYPYYLSADYLPPFRAERIRQVLADNARVSKAGFKELQGDYKCLEAAPFIQIIANMEVQAPGAKDLLDRLRTWDQRLGPDSAGGAIYVVLFYRLLENTFKDDLGEAADAFFGRGLTPLNPLNTFVAHSRLILVHAMADPTSAWFDDTTTPAKETLNEMLSKSLVETDAFLRRTLGPDPTAWRWGRLHQIVFQHPLGQVKPLDKLFNLGPFEAGGHFSTVWQSGVLPGMDFNYNGWTVSNRHIYDLADWDNSLGTIVPGQSGMWGSPHYSDQMEMWRTVGHHPLYFSKERVEAEATKRLTLTP